MFHVYIELLHLILTQFGRCWIYEDDKDDEAILTEYIHRQELKEERVKKNEDSGPIPMEKLTFAVNRVVESMFTQTVSTLA